MLPHDATEHIRTFICFGAHKKIWGKKLPPIVEHNLATLSSTISRFEPVVVLVPSGNLERAKALIGSGATLEITYVPTPCNDIWIRDTSPLFVKDHMATYAVDFHFNGWGLKQKHNFDSRISQHIIRHYNFPSLNTDICLEGGGIEVDGEGTAIVNESCVLNNNRNKNMSKQYIENEMRRLLGISKVIWLPGIVGKDITDAHIDAYVRFLKPAVLMVFVEEDPTSYEYHLTKSNFEILKASTDTLNRPFELIVVNSPAREYLPPQRSKDFLANYLNFYICNHAIILASFGDEKVESYMRDVFNHHFPEREVVLVNIDGIASGGGGIHCCTMQQPL